MYEPRPTQLSGGRGATDVECESVGTMMPIHRHMKSSETVECQQGNLHEFSISITGTFL